MHFVGLLVLVFLPCCISRAAFNEDATGASPVNGQQGDWPLEDAAKYDNSKRSENVLKEQAQFSDEGAASAAPVNGQHGDAPLMAPAKLDRWVKYSSNTSWCTIDGRSEISKGEEIDNLECQRLCRAIEGCNAVEFWEDYNWACFQCTDTSLIESYTNEDDLAYPVYVWIRVWRKHSPYTSWCTIDGRSEISKDEEIDHLECQKRCQAIEGCNAVEFWENYNWACFQCTNTSLIEPYTYKANPAYPVHVWVP